VNAFQAFTLPPVTPQTMVEILNRTMNGQLA